MDENGKNVEQNVSNPQANEIQKAGSNAALQAAPTVNTQPVGEGNLPQNNGVQPNNVPQADTGTANIPPFQAGQPPYIPVMQTGWQPVPYVPKPKEPFEVKKEDILFSIFSLVLGFLFIRWLLFFGFWQGWGVTAFTFLYAGGALLYAKAKKIQASKSSWFWFAILLLTGLSYSLWPSGELTFYQNLLLFGSALYWSASMFGSLIFKKTSNFLPLDAINLLFVIPFKNFALSVKGIAAIFSRQKTDKKKMGKTVVAVIMGVLVSILLLAIILPMLLAADDGIFSQMMTGIVTFIDNLITESLTEILIQIAFGIPVALYIGGLIMGQAHKRYTSTYKAEEMAKKMQGKRIVPVVTVAIVLSAVSVIYLLFVFSQIPYYFSAFSGVKPAEFTVYSEYARQGFFELCRVATINLLLLVVANTFTTIKRDESPLLKIMNIILACLTLLVLITAFSKMFLYIQVQGFTQKRVMTCVFMAFLAIVCIALIVLQWKKFSIIRFSAVIGSVMLCALCLCNLDGVVVSYNAHQYKSGNLSSFDTLILQRSGPSGAWAAMDVLETDPEDGREIKDTLGTFKDEAKRNKWTSRDCLVYAMLRNTDIVEQVKSS